MATVGFAREAEVRVDVRVAETVGAVVAACRFICRRTRAATDVEGAGVAEEESSLEILEVSEGERDDELSVLENEEVSVTAESSEPSVVVTLIGTLPTTERALFARSASMSVAEVLRASESYFQAEELTFLIIGGGG